MATLAPTRPHHTADHIRQFERKIIAAKQIYSNLPREDFYDQLFVIIHRPGWTTIAEGLFFEAALESLMTQSQHLAQLHHQILAAANAVQAD